MNKKHEVIWTSSAENDLAGIIEYLAADSPANALKVLDKLKEKAANLYHSPKRGRIIPELQEYGIHQYREIIAAPWRLMYRAQEDKVYVIAVLDSRQNIEDILLKKVLTAKL
ncbi:type II toxin-antitoxin system RelE/ParE family toxin [Acidobacteriota bacterium]